MPETVLLAEPRGFCAGVEMAIKALTWMVRIFEPPVYCYHEIVHNEAVVDAFQKAGVVFVDSIDEVPDGAPVMLSAHGSAPDVVAGATAKAAITVDAVCPLVTKVHHEVRRKANDGFDIIYIGHEGHDEAMGTAAEAPHAVTLVDPASGMDHFSPADDSRVALLAQTTLGMFEWEEVLTTARARYPELWTARKSDLCYATTNRQTVVQELTKRCDLILVVGSENSSNTNALVRVAQNAGVPAYRVDGPEDVDPAWLTDTRVVGVTAGASAPDQRVQAVIQTVNPTNGVEVMRLTAEDEYFPLPPTLRSFIATLQALVEGVYGCRRPGLPGLMEEDRTWTATEALELIGVKA